MTVGKIIVTCDVSVVQPATSISLNRTTLFLNAADTFRMTATVYPENAQRDVEWSSSDDGVAKVDQSGLITAISQGTAEITALAKDGSGVSKSCKVTVKGEKPNVEPTAEPTADISLVTDRAVLQIGGTVAIRIKSVSPADDIISYESSDTKVATVDSAGIVTGKGAGNAEIIVSSAAGAKAIFQVEVVDLTLKTGSAAIQVGKSVSIKIDSKYPENDTVTYTSSDTKVATVDSAGKVTGKSTGTAKITVTTGSGVQKEFQVKVIDIILKSNSAAIQVGKKATIKVKSKYPKNDTVTYKSSNTKIATVDSKGKVTAKSTGTAKITVMTKSGAKRIFKVKVVDLKLISNSATIRVGKTVKIKIKSQYPKKEAVTYKSSNPKVATVNKKGKVTGKSEGTAKITVTTKSGAKATFKVKVKKE